MGAWCAAACCAGVALGSPEEKEPAAPVPQSAGRALTGQWQTEKPGAITNSWAQDAAGGEWRSLPLDIMTSGGDDDLIWPEVMGDFELSFEFLFKMGGAGGVEYLRPENVSVTNHLRGCIYAVADESRHPATRLAPARCRNTGALFDLLGPVAQATPAPIGEWNQGRIIVRGTRVEHWLNGLRVLATDTAQPELQALVARSVFRDDPQYGRRTSGRIVLLRGDGNVFYRNVRLLPLTLPSPKESQGKK